jgi:hypothetical protein
MLIDTVIRRAGGPSRLRAGIEVVPPNNGFVPERYPGLRNRRHLR